MANFMGVTASSGAKIKKGKEKEVRKLIEQYPSVMEDGGVELDKDGCVAVWGYDWLNIGKLNNNGEVEMDDDYSEEFFAKLAPLLAEKLIVHCVGNEKCRFPLSAVCIEVDPNGGEPVVFSGALKTE